MSESRPSSGYPGPIADLPPGFFWTKSSMVGMTEEEQLATDRGEILPEKRADELRYRLLAARNALMFAPVNAARI